MSEKIEFEGVVEEHALRFLGGGEVTITTDGALRIEVGEKYYVTLEPIPELKPCPFCGGEAEFRVNTRYTFSECTQCGARLWRETLEEAQEAWNKRADG